MRCPKCNTLSSSYIISDNGAENPFKAAYCPLCGSSYSAPAETSNLTKVSASIFDKSTVFTNCTVEVLENTFTGDVSVGWLRTEDTEEIPGETIDDDENCANDASDDL